MRYYASLNSIKTISKVYLLRFSNYIQTFEIHYKIFIDLSIYTSFYNKRPICNAHAMQFYQQIIQYLYILMKFHIKFILLLITIQLNEFHILLSVSTFVDNHRR